MRADLQALIDYTGLSIGDAAAIVGCGHEAMSRKLAGKPRYEARPEEIEALLKVADYQDGQVRACLAALARMREEHPSDDEGIVLLTYRRDVDLPPGDLYPASVTRMIASRIKREAPIQTHLVLFDHATYDAWRGGAPDTRIARQEWAVNQSAGKQGLRLSFKVGGRTGDLPPGAEGRPMTIGWAALRYGPTTLPQRIEAGKLSTTADAHCK
jgi:hypothetical protein